MKEKIIELIEKQKEIKNKLGNHELSFMECELEIRNLVNEFEKILQEDTLKNLKEPTIINSMECECGKTSKYSGKKKTLKTGRTEINIERRSYYCKGCMRTTYPLDEAYGLVDVRGFSPLMVLIMSYLSAKMSYEEGKETIKELLNIEISSTAVQNQSEKLGKEIFNSKFSYIPSDSQKRCDKMVIMADGGMLHIGKEEYKEVRVGIIIKFYANEGFTIHKIAICENAEKFTKDFYDFCLLHGSSACREIIIIGDGASWLDSFKWDYFPSAVRIIDYYHAKEYLIKALKYLYGAEWQKKGFSYYLLGLLENGECLEIANELKKRMEGDEDRETDLYKAKRYYENHYDKMRYKDYEDKGYPIGSGEVEGGVRHIVHDRMGKSRSTWTVEDANKILILRSYLINGYWGMIKQKRYQKKWIS
jgi:hypothetical protein